MDRHRQKLTVDVISEEQTSQTYLTPPSPPLVTVFLRMTPILPDTPDGELLKRPLLELHYRLGRGWERDRGSENGDLYCASGVETNATCFLMELDALGRWLMAI